MRSSRARTGGSLTWADVQGGAAAGWPRTDIASTCADKVGLAAMDQQHRTSDLQSLLLTEAAIAALRQQPALMAAVQSPVDLFASKACAAREKDLDFIPPDGR